MIKLFISYSQDSEEVKSKVLSLSNLLNELGLDCTIDQYEIMPEKGWVRWMNEMVSKSNFVLIVITENYSKKLNDEIETGKGLGVKFEGHLILSEFLTYDIRNKKFIPILFNKSDEIYIPTFLKSYTHFIFDNEISLQNKSFEMCYRYITNQPLVTKPKIGKIYNFDSKTELVKSSKKIIEITIDGEFDAFTADDQNNILLSIGNILKIPSAEVKIYKKIKGSIKLYIMINDNPNIIFLNALLGNKFGDTLIIRSIEVLAKYQIIDIICNVKLDDKVKNKLKRINNFIVIDLKQNSILISTLEDNIIKSLIELSFGYDILFKAISEKFFVNEPQAQRLVQKFVNLSQVRLNKGRSIMVPNLPIPVDEFELTTYVESFLKEFIKDLVIKANNLSSFEYSIILNINNFEFLGINNFFKSTLSNFNFNHINIYPEDETSNIEEHSMEFIN